MKEKLQKTGGVSEGQGFLLESSDTMDGPLIKTLPHPQAWQPTKARKQPKKNKKKKKKKKKAY